MIKNWVINQNSSDDVRALDENGKEVFSVNTGHSFETLFNTPEIKAAINAPYSVQILAPKTNPTPVPTPQPTSIWVAIPHSWKNGGDNSKAPTVARNSSGRYLITSDADTDADGSLRVGSIDPDSGQSETSLRRSNGWKGANANCDSEVIPFFVLPLNWVKTTGDSKCHLGDVAKLTYKTKSVYAIFADQGPNALIGEASICAIEKLGGNPWNADKTKVVRGIPYGVTYEYISGSANLARTVDFESIQKYGRELFEGAAVEPTPVPVPQPTPQPVPTPEPIPTPTQPSAAVTFITYFKSNFLEVDKEVERWFAGKYSPDATKNACVAHQVSCLKLCGLPYPTLGTMESINVDYFVDWALMNKWTRITDMNKLVAGDICVSGPSDTDIDHVYAFVSYVDVNNANVLHNQCVGIGKRSLIGVGCGKWRFAVRMPGKAANPVPTKPNPAPLADFSATFAHLKNVKNDIELTDVSQQYFWAALQSQIADKEAFNTRVNLGVKPAYGTAQCATTTASVLEGAAIKAGLPNVAELFSKVHRDKDEFALTHQIEIMLKRLGFVMYAKATHVAPQGAIGMMVGRYDFAGCSQHSGHVFSIYEDKGVGQHDIICDNGGWNHTYSELTESFFVPPCVAPVKREEHTPDTTGYKGVLINAGHAGTAGARGANPAIKEEEMNALQAKTIQQILRNNGIICTIVNQNEVGGLSAVGKAAQDYNMAIALHFNATNRKEHGTGYLGGQNKPATKAFAMKVCNAIGKEFGYKVLGYIDMSVTVTNEFDKTNCPIAFLLESSFIDDETDLEKFKKEVIRTAEIIADCIIAELN